MIPRLINNLEETTNEQVIWINEAANFSQYKNIEKVLFLALHPTTKAPYLLNYAVSQENMELNFEITTVWGFLKDWIIKEKMELDHNIINDQIVGNYIMQFNKNMELIYINNFDKKELGHFFCFPGTVGSPKDLSLENLIKYRPTYEQIKNIVDELIENDATEYELSKPNMLIKLILGINSSFRGLYLIFKSSALYSIKSQDMLRNITFAIQPMAMTLDDQQNLDNMDVISQSNASFLESLKINPNVSRSRMTSKGPSKFQQSSNRTQGREAALIMPPPPPAEPSGEQNAIKFEIPKIRRANRLHATRFIRERSPHDTYLTHPQGSMMVPRSGHSNGKDYVNNQASNESILGKVLDNVKFSISKEFIQQDDDEVTFAN